MGKSEAWVVVLLMIVLVHALDEFWFTVGSQGTMLVSEPKRDVIAVSASERGVSVDSIAWPWLHSICHKAT